MTTNNHDSDGRARKLARHLSQLARAFGIRVVVRRKMPPHEAGAGYMRVNGQNTSQRCIIIAPVIDEATYAVALHELGHCCSAFGMLHEHGSRRWRTTNQLSCMRDVRLKMEEERAAWEWARHYALEWTDLMTFVERIGVESYERKLRRKL